jgi:hypothetical protein
LAIPHIIPNSVNRVVLRHSLRVAAQVCCVGLGLAIAARTVDWSAPEQQLARKVATLTGPGTVGLTVENRSSLGKRDSEVVQNGLRSALERLGIRAGKPDQTAATVAISLSENPSSYVWVAEIRKAGGEVAVVMVSAPRSDGGLPQPESVPLSLHRISLWTQDDPILDVAVLEESATPTRIAVLNAESLELYRLIGGKWQQEQTLEIVHVQPWPRDLRGRLIPAKDHLLDIYLPGVICRSAAGTQTTLNCRESDDPWPMVPANLSAGSPSALRGATSATPIPPVGAFYASTRNFFTGALSPGSGKVKTVSKFYSAAMLPRENDLLWLFAATDGHVHMVEGTNDQTAKLNWGSEMTSVKTSCGAGWQVIATSSQEGTGDSVRAYEFPDHDPVAVSPALDFSSAGVVMSLWTEPKGDTAVAVVKNRETGNYEAFRLAMACSQ